MASSTPFKPKQNTEYKIDQDTIDGVLKKRFKTEKKPVKFTWEGVKNLLTTVSPLENPKLKLDRIKDLTEGSSAQEKDYIDFFEDIEKATLSGVDKLSYAISDLVTSGIDTTLGRLPEKNTRFNERLTKVYEQNKMKEPETLTGKVTEVLTQYGVPGAAGFKILNRVKKLATLQKAKKATASYIGTTATNILAKSGTMGGAFAITDFVASEPGRANLFLKEEDTENLSGTDLAAARFRNRLRFGAEGAAIGGVFSLIGKPAAVVGKYGVVKPVGLGLKYGVGPVFTGASWLLSKDKVILPNVSKALREGSTYSLEKIMNPILRRDFSFEQLPPFKKWQMFSVNDASPLKARLKKLDNVLSWFRSIGDKTGQQFTLTSRAAREIKARARTIEKYLESIEVKAYALAKGFKNQHNTKTVSPSSEKHYLDQVLSYLKGDIRLDRLPSLVRDSSKNLKIELTKIKKVFGDMLPESELKDYILKNVNTYMRKSFAIFTDPTYRPDKKVMEGAVKYMSNLIKNNNDLRKAALGEFTGFKPEAAIKKYAESLTKKMLHEGKTNSGDPLAVLSRIAKTNLRLKDIVRTGEELPDAIKRLLGEENNLKASVLTTASHAITQSTNKKLFDRLAALGIKEGWLFKDEARANARGILDAEKIKHVPGLGFLGSRLDRYFASRQVAEAFRGTPGRLDNLIQSDAYRAILQLKVATQFGKTVLSPATQVRNVTSASLFPLANGHIGGGASVTEAFKMVADDIFGAGKVIDEQKLIQNIEDKIRRGVIDENIVASELGAVLKDIKKGSINSLDGLYNKLTNGKFMKTSTRIYAGGDNLWKWFGDEYVQSQMRSTYRTLPQLKAWFKEIQGQDFIARDLFSNKLKTYDDAIKEAASWYIRNTYPTYSKVPEAIKAIRKLPFGNFVSFPAEMMRTTYNITNIAAKEISSSNPLLRQMGYRRMMGAYTVLGGAGTAAINLASELTGVTLDEIEAYKSSFAADWNKNATILPLDKWIKGKGKAINFSYFSPYDVVQKPVEAFMRAHHEGKMSNQDIDDMWMSIASETLGEIFNSFVSEPIGYERILDTLPRGKFGRGGQKKAGGFVYSDTDSPGDKVSKSFAHFIQGIEPGALTTARKIAGGIEGELKPGGEPYSLRDEALALFSGIRIINVDTPRTMNYKMTDFRRNKLSVTKAESFYSLRNALDRGPNELQQEFRNIQDEMFRVQQEFHYVLQDAQKLGLTKRDLRKILMKRDFSGREISALLRGKFTPFKASEKLMQKRVRDAKKAYPDEKIESSFFYPRREFYKIMREYRNKSLKYQIPRPEPVSEFQVPKPILSLPTNTRQVASVQTPPLPATPPVNPQLVAANNPVIPQTGLTRTETALLSPSEQAMRLRSRGQA